MKTYAESRAKIIKFLEGHKVALTTDMWTSPKMIAFMGITVSLLTEKFEPVTIIIGFKHVLGSHTGVNLAEYFFEVMKDYNLVKK